MFYFIEVDLNSQVNAYAFRLYHYISNSHNYAYDIWQYNNV